MFDLTGKRVLITGGTGSLGSTLVRKLLSGVYGAPETVTVFSRDEDKQHRMRLYYERTPLARLSAGNGHATRSAPALRFALGDVRDYAALRGALRDAQVVVHAAALKHVPNCEYFPSQAVMTNVEGARNLVRAVAEGAGPVEAVVGISTDKACEPINVMGMTKALQERILIEGNLAAPGTRFVCVRYGNVIASRGSVIPIYVDQIREGGPVTVTTREMTRFLISLDDAVDTIAAALRHARAGEVFVPRLVAARMEDVARALMGDRDLPIVFLGIRPGEKVHEVLVSETECLRTTERAGHYVIAPVLPEVAGPLLAEPALGRPYTSRDVSCDVRQLADLLREHVERASGRQPLAVA